MEITKYRVSLALRNLSLRFRGYWRCMWWYPAEPSARGGFTLGVTLRDGIEGVLSVFPAPHKDSVWKTSHRLLTVFKERTSQL